MTVEINQPWLNLLLSQYFVFDKIFNLVDYTIDLSQLHHELSLLRKDKFENNYRFIFLHYDTDYHIDKNQPGLILRNLQKILFDLDISNYFCMIISQKDLQPHLDILKTQETTDDCSIFCLQHPLEEGMHFEKMCVNLNKNAVKYNFICLNKVKRKHRLILYSL